MHSAAQGARGGGQVSLLNIITELKKCCNHPFLFESAETDFRGSDDSKAVDRLVVTSGKMVLLDKLLRRLKETGHRCALCLVYGHPYWLSERAFVCH